MSTRLHIVVSDELVAAVDAARGDVPRSAWVRRAVERALDAPSVERVFGRLEGKGIVGPAPESAEQPEALERMVPSTGESLDGARLVPERPRRAVRSHAPNCKCPVCS